MPYIPKEHEKYDLLPLCRKEGGEVFDYPGELICEVELLLKDSATLFPYNFDSYDEYYHLLDSLIIQYSAVPDTAKKLCELKETVFAMNQKEEWSVLRYLGPSDDSPMGLTQGRYYYWPTRASDPVYCGVVDDEEFTAYIYPTDVGLWEIAEDPTGMARRILIHDVFG